MMLRKRSSRWAGAKALYVLPVVCLALGAFARTTYVSPDVPQDKGNTNFEETTAVAPESPPTLPPGVEVVDDVHIRVRVRNLFNVFVNDRGEILTGCSTDLKPTEFAQLKARARAFLLNVQNDRNMAEKQVTEFVLPDGEKWNYAVSQGILSLQTTKNNPLEAKVLYELTAAINELRDEVSMAKFGKKFAELPDGVREVVAKAVPMSISTAEKEIWPRKIELDSARVEPRPDGTFDFKVYGIHFDKLSDMAVYPLILINGRPSNADQLNLLDKEDILMVNVIKTTEMVEKYGERAKDGVVEVTTKDAMPSFLGGDMNTFREWVTSQVGFPQEALDAKASGRVNVQFAVEPDGSVGEVKVLSSPHPALSREVVRVLESSPQWTPAMLDGAPTTYRLVIPVEFKH